MIHILIVDHRDYLRRMFRALLQTQEGWAVSGEASNGKEAVDQSKLLSPNLVVIDMQLPVTSGLDAARQILLIFPQILILFLALDASPQFALAAAACGAQGILLKSLASENLVVAVSTLLRGERYFPAYG